jgi:N-acetylglucosamine-6-phosphate deacetylase
MKTVIAGASVVTPGGLLPHAAVLCDGDSIDRVVPDGGELPEADVTIDASGLVLAPGFIELQVNGGFGVDLTSTPDSIWTLGARLVEFGITAFLPTIISSPPEVARSGQAVIVSGEPDGYRGASALGLHLEGPFLSPAKRGAHPVECLRTPSQEEIERWWPAEGVAMVTLAPDLPGAVELTRELTARGIVVAAGHSAAEFEAGIAAIDAGVRYGTHLFNAMSGLDHRAPGLAAALLSDKRAIVGMIVDGAHIHPEMIRMVWRLVGPVRVSLISDAMAGLGMGCGRFPLGEHDVLVAGGSARLEDGTLAGSVVSLDTALRNLVAITGCDLVAAIGAVTSVPTRLLGLTDRGWSPPAGARTSCC